MRFPFSREPVCAVSTHEIARKTFGPSIVNALSNSTPDRRELLSALGRYLELSEEEIVKLIARKASLPFMDSIDCARLNSAPFITDKSLLYTRAFIPLDVSYRTVVCSEPKWLDVPTSTNIYLSSWSVIKEALDQLVMVPPKSLNEKKVEPKQSALSEFTPILINFLESKNAKTVMLIEAEEKIYYELIALDLKTYRGYINSPEARDAFSVASRTPGVTNYVFTQEGSERQLNVSLDYRAHSRTLFFTWGPHTPPLVHHATIRN